MTAIYYQFINPLLPGTQTMSLIGVQILTGIAVAAIVYVPTTLLGFVFRRIKERDTRTALGEKALALHIVDNQLMRPHNALERALFDWRLPWWVEIAVYLITVLGWLLCFYVTILYGVKFSDTQANSWIISFAVSVIASALVIQCLLALLAGFFYTFANTSANSTTTTDVPLGQTARYVGSGAGATTGDHDDGAGVGGGVIVLG